MLPRKRHFVTLRRTPGAPCGRWMCTVQSKIQSSSIQYSVTIRSSKYKTPKLDKKSNPLSLAKWRRAIPLESSRYRAAAGRALISPDREPMRGHSGQGLHHTGVSANRRSNRVRGLRPRDDCRIATGGTAAGATRSPDGTMPCARRNASPPPTHRSLAHLYIDASGSAAYVRWRRNSSTASS